MNTLARTISRLSRWLLPALLLVGEARGFASSPETPPSAVTLTMADEALLRRALEAGGEVRLAFDQTLTLSAPLVIGKDAVLDAMGHKVTLSGDRKVRVFEVRTNVQLTLRNLTIADGFSDRGGGLLNDGGSVTLLGCTFVSNRAEGSAGPPGADAVNSPSVAPSVAAIEDLGGIVDLKVVNGHAYVAADGLVILDVRSPAQPVRLGRLAPTTSETAPRSIQVDGSLAYVAAGRTSSGTTSRGRFEVVEVADPTQPRRLGSCATRGTEALQLFVSRSRAYVADLRLGDRAHLEIIDVANPAQPKPIGNYVHPDSYPYAAFRAVFVREPHAYLLLNGSSSARRGAVVVVDITDPAAPRQVANQPSTLREEAPGADMVVVWPYALVVSGGTYVPWVQVPRLLEMFDLSDPVRPLPVGTYAGLPAAVLDDVPRVVQLDAFRAYVTSASQILEVDVRRPSSPVAVRAVTPFEPEALTALALADDFAYVGTTKALRIVPLASFSAWPVRDPTPTDLAGGIGGAACGGALFNQGSLIASECTFNANVAAAGPGGRGGWIRSVPGWPNLHYGGVQGLGGPGGRAAGGAVYQEAGSMRYVNCVFARNIAEGGPGGSAPECSAGTVGEGGAGGAACGGALYAESGGWEALGCSIDTNAALGGLGGAVGRLEAAKTSQTNNLANLGNGGRGGVGQGGAIFTRASAVLEGCRIFRNRAVGGPGGLGGTASFPDMGTITSLTFRVGEGGAGGEGEGGALWSEASLTLRANAWLENRSDGGTGGVGAVGTDGGFKSPGGPYGHAAPGGTGGVGGLARGGALRSHGVVEHLNSTVTGNRAQGGMGGAGGPGGRYRDSRGSGTTMKGGSGGPGGTGFGGAFLNVGGSVRLRHLTIVGNSASAGAGGSGGRPVDEYADPRLSGPPGVPGGTPHGGGLLNTSGGITLANSIVANNEPGGNFNGSIQDLGHNLSSDTSTPLAGPGSRTNVDPWVGALGDYGGPTPSIPLLANSPALDAAGPAACPEFDQRGVRRPQGRGCDIGALEGPGLEPPQVLLSARNTMVRVGESIDLDLELRNPNPALTLSNLSGQVLLPSGLVRVDGSLEYTNLSLAPGMSTRIPLTVRVDKLGDFAVAATAGSSLTDPRTVVRGIRLQGGGPPEVLTSWARWQSAGTATLESLAIARGPASTAWFQYGTGTGLDSVSVAAPVPNGFDPQGVRTTLPSVSTASPVRYRVVVSNAFGVVEGPIQDLAPARDLTRCQESDLRTAVAAGGYLRWACDGIIELTAPLVIATNVVLDAGERDVTLSGLNTVRVLEIAEGADLTFVNVKVVEGFSPTQGAGLVNSNGWARVFGGAFLSNRVAGPTGTPTLAGGAVAGGAIHNAGFLLLEATRLERNSAQGGDGCSPQTGAADPRASAGGAALGGAIAHASGTAVVRRCAMVSNQVAGGDGGNARPPSALNAHGGNGGSAAGGAVFHSGERLFVTETTVEQNRALGGSAGLRSPLSQRFRENTNGVAGPASGGGIDSHGELLVARSLLTRNVVTGGAGIPGDYEPELEFPMNWIRPSQPGGDVRGAAIASAGATLIANTTIARNIARPGPGGTAVSAETPPPRNGTAVGGGLGVTADAVLILNTTWAGNEADTGADVDIHGGTGQLANSILAGDVTTNRLSGPIVDLGSNLATATDAPLPAVSSRTGADPRLLPLADNGGPTWTLALASDSPAIDAGNDTFSPSFDQRGEPRPTGGASDIGAFEIQPPPLAPSATATLQADGSVRLRFVAWPNRRVVLEATSDWHEWRGVVTNLTDAAGVLETVATDTHVVGSRFYRLRSEP